MTLQEYYKLPEGTNVNVNFIQHWLIDKPNFPCPASMYKAFVSYGGSYVPPLDVSKVTNMSYMFESCSKLTTIDGIEDWDTSNVTDMSNMFYYCGIPSLDLSNWDTSNVTNMERMFFNTSNLISVDSIKNWDVSKVTNMGSILEGCKTLTSIDLSNWDTSKVTNMSSMFNSCEKLTSLSSLRTDSLSMASYQGFFGYNEIKTLTDFGGFINLKTSLTSDYNLKKLPNLTYESCINVLNGLYNFTGNGETPTSSQGQLKVHSNFLTLVGEKISIGTDKGWIITA